MNNEIVALKNRFDLFNDISKFESLFNNMNFSQAGNFTNSHILAIKKFTLASLFCIESYLERIFPINYVLCNQLIGIYFGGPSLDDNTLDFIVLQIHPLLTQQSNNFKLSCSLESKQIFIDIEKFLIFLINSSVQRQAVADMTLGLSCFVLRQRNGGYLIANTDFSSSSKHEHQKFILHQHDTTFKAILSKNLLEIQRLVLLLLIYLEGYIQAITINEQIYTALLTKYNLKLEKTLIEDRIQLLVTKGFLSKENGRKRLSKKFLDNLRSEQIKVYLEEDTSKKAFDLRPLIITMVKFMMVDKTLEQKLLKKWFTCYAYQALQVIQQEKIEQQRLEKSVEAYQDFMSFDPWKKLQTQKYLAEKNLSLKRPRVEEGKLDQQKKHKENPLASGKSKEGEKTEKTQNTLKETQDNIEQLTEMKDPKETSADEILLEMGLK